MKKFKSLYFRNFLTMAGVLLVCFLILGTAFFSMSYRFSVNEKQESMSTTAQETVRVIEAYSTIDEVEGFNTRMTLTAISNISGYHVMVCNSEGLIVSCSDVEMVCGHIGKYIPEGVMNTITGTENYSDVSNLGGIFDKDQYVVTMAVPASDGSDSASYYVIFSIDARSMVTLWRQFASMFGFASIIVLCIAFAASIITSKKQTKPINEMAVAANRFARGDFDMRVSETGRNDEIGELADAFNMMADSLQRSEKTRTEFIANVSHELKTPMTTITGFADGMLDGTIKPEEYDHYLRVISSETKRLSRLVRGMLDMSHMQTADPAAILSKSFDFCEVVRVTILSLEQKINDKKLDLDVQMPEEDMIVRGDMDAITQVVYNLMDNAIKFAPEGTIITIEMWKQGEKAHFSVENHGDTISREELPMIFDRFHKTDKSRSNDRSGVGLGLYIVKTILDNHNEDIFVTSQDGLTKFMFTMTLKQPEKKQPEKNQK